MDKKNVRYNILIILIYIIGLVLILQLFNLQIIHGEEYLETSSTRLTREITLKASRGNIKDRNGNILASTQTKYTLEIYKSEIDNDVLNNTLLEVINTLIENGDEYIDSFPVNSDGTEFTISDTLSSWKQSNSISEDATPQEVMQIYKQKYKIKNEKIEDIRKIIVVRYGIEKNGYSAMKGYTIANSISIKSVAIFEEENNYFPRNLYNYITN